jgi:DNA-binding response OmpR family regulator
MADDKRNSLLYVACRRGRPRQLLSPVELRPFVDSHLQADGAPWFDWNIVSSQKLALRGLRRALPQLALVELDMAHQRLEFCAALRERAPTLKIVALGAGRELSSAAVDAFLCLPVDTAQVLACILRLLDHPVGASTIHAGPLHLDLHTGSVTSPKGQHHMTPKAAALLYYFMTHHNQVLSRRELMQNIWNTTFLGDTRTLDVHIRWLREYIEENPSEPKLLTTVRGRGYRLRLE